MNNEYNFLDNMPNVLGLAMLSSAFMPHEKDGRVSSVELSRGHDYHGFYRLGNGNENKVVHVQFYPGMSSVNEARVFARLMDYNKMLEIRKQGGTSKGNEHQAVIKPFPNFGCGIIIPDYNTKLLERMIEENVEELK